LHETSVLSSHSFLYRLPLLYLSESPSLSSSATKKMSYHLHRSGRHPHVVSPLPSIQVDEFFRSYSLSGQAPVAAVDHRGIELVVDGWAAARAVAKHFPLEEDDEALAETLLKKVARTQDLVSLVSIVVKSTSRLIDI